MAHSKEIWTKIHKMFKWSHCKQSYSSLWYNSIIEIGRTSVFGRGGIVVVYVTLLIYLKMCFISYSDLVRKYKLKGKYNFWKYLQIRSCITAKIQYRDGNHIMDYFKPPGEYKQASIFYRKTNQLLSYDLYCQVSPNGRREPNSMTIEKVSVETVFIPSRGQAR